MRWNRCERDAWIIGCRVRAPGPCRSSSTSGRGRNEAEKRRREAVGGPFNPSFITQFCLTVSFAFGLWDLHLSTRRERRVRRRRVQFKGEGAGAQHE